MRSINMAETPQTISFVCISLSNQEFVNCAFARLGLAWCGYSRSFLDAPDNHRCFD